MSMLVSSATTVARRLEETRRMRGLTTREIAALIGVSQGTVSRWERGLGEPTITQFALWAEATKQPLSAMTEGLSWCARRDSNSQPSDWEFPADYRCPCRDDHDRGDCPYGCSCAYCAPDIDDLFWSIIACQEIPDTGLAFPAGVAL